MASHSLSFKVGKFTLNFMSRNYEKRPRSVDEARLMHIRILRGIQRAT